MPKARRERLLVVDDDAGVVDWLLEELTEEGFRVEGVTSPHEALARIEAESFDLVVSDVEMPGMRGLDLLGAIQERRAAQLVLLITAFGTIDLAVQAVRAGACDFVSKPLRIEALVVAIERALREREMRREIVRLRKTLAQGSEGELIARSAAMQRVLDVARRAAATESTVLLTGESGVGKSAIARFVHEQSPHAEGPFVQLNCAALPSSLVEAELFGVRKGAYTDARAERAGLFLQADGGTLFLDEIGEMDLEVQPKLLSALESRRIRPLGGSTDVTVSTRIIAATNRPLEEALRERRLRPDLYHRLNVIRIEVPPLRERPEDIEALIDVLLARTSEALGRPVAGIAADAMRFLRVHSWPGNVRELSNAIERAVALSEHDTLVLSDFQDATRSVDGDALDRAAAGELSLAEIELAYIRKVLERVDWNKAQAARILGIDRRTLYRKAAEIEATTAAGRERKD